MHVGAQVGNLDLGSEPHKHDDHYLPVSGGSTPVLRRALPPRAAPRPVPAPRNTAPPIAPGILVTQNSVGSISVLQAPPVPCRPSLAAGGAAQGQRLPHHLEQQATCPPSPGGDGVYTEIGNWGGTGQPSHVASTPGTFDITRALGGERPPDFASAEWVHPTTVDRRGAEQILASAHAQPGTCVLRSKETGDIVVSVQTAKDGVLNFVIKKVVSGNETVWRVSGKDKVFRSFTEVIVSHVTVPLSQTVGICLRLIVGVGYRR